MTKSSSIKARTKGATSASVSGLTTTNGYSTRQSVASVTCVTRASPSNIILCGLVILLKRSKICRRFWRVSSKLPSKRSTAFSAAATNTSTCGLSSRRLRISFKRWRISRTSAARRFGCSSKSSTRYGLRTTTQISPNTSNNIRAERPVLRCPRKSCRICHASSPNRRMTISRSV